MTGGQDHSGDAVRQLLVEISADIEESATHFGFADPVNTHYSGRVFAAAPRLVAAVTAVLDRAAALQAEWANGDVVYSYACEFEALVAAALEEQP